MASPIAQDLLMIEVTTWDLDPLLVVVETQYNKGIT